MYTIESVDGLKPCPFCGGKAELKKDLNGYESKVSIICTYCGATVTAKYHSYNCYSHGSFDEDYHNTAIAFWNRRVDNSITSATDVAPVVHGHIIWRERHSGGFISRRCLINCGNRIFTPSCNNIAKIDDRCIVNLPYCSVCDKLLGDFLNYCPNCGAKMDADKNES